MTDYRSTKAKLNEMRARLEKHGLYISTWAPGDGVTRYRFHTKDIDYFADDGIYTALGWKEAEIYARGLLDGIEHATKPQDPPK